MANNSPEAKLVALNEAGYLAQHLFNTLERIHAHYGADLGSESEETFKRARLLSIDLMQIVDEARAWGLRPG